MTEEQDPFFAFEWYFTDVSEIDGARFHALGDKPLETSVLMNLRRADSLVHFALWSELPENHPVGQLWLETQTDLLSTIYLAYGGFFAKHLLFFELGLKLHCMVFSFLLILVSLMGDMNNGEVVKEMLQQKCRKLQERLRQDPIK